MYGLKVDNHAALIQYLCIQDGVFSAPYSQVCIDGGHSRGTSTTCMNSRWTGVLHLTYTYTFMVDTRAVTHLHVWNDDGQASGVTNTCMY